MYKATKHGFTLIELLIVVAIIAILAAIAIPNFLAAQTRSKVSRVKEDMRSIGTGLEAYRTDNENYPIGFDLSGEYPVDFEFLYPITTPIAYLTSIPLDPFFTARDNTEYGYTKSGPKPYWYWGIPRKDPNFGIDGGVIRQCGWRIASSGPDGRHDKGIPQDAQWELNWIDYDPTNGTISRGEIMRWGPGNSDPIPVN
ncbi:MAG: type II secretion system protein [bacterium]